MQAPVMAVTGHRPARITDVARVRKDLADTLAERRPGHLLQGMAEGADLWAAAAAWYARIPFSAVRPWAGHTAATPEAYAWALRNATEVVTVDDAEAYPGPQAFHARNRWMVDRAETLLAVWDGKQSGGTWQTVKYARTRGLEIITINP